MFRKSLMGLAFASALTLGTAMAEVVVKVAPPAAVVETRPAAPGAYVWVPGRWEQPPRPHARWVAHRWVHRGGGYVMVEGHWR
jgi:hypothetical protein